MMSAQRTEQSSSVPTTSKQDQTSNQQSALTQRSFLPSVSSLLLDPFGFFDDTPFSFMSRLQREMNRAISQSRQSGSGRGDGAAGALWVPPIEVANQEGNFVITAELPGVSDEDVTVEVTDDAVVIRGERQVERDEDRGQVHRTERMYGQFLRAIPLPDGADPEKARAEFKNGLLKISVPVAQSQSNVRQIPIETSSGSSQSTAGSSQSSTSQGNEQKPSTSETPARNKAA
jgi:HSP20 family protein